MSDPMAEIRASFFIECEELLESLQDGLQLMDDGDNDAETINVVFRAVHSIKGGAGAFGLDDLVHFAHRFETAMDEVRAGRFVPDAEAVKLFFACADLLGDLVRAARDGDAVPESLTAPVLAALDAAVGMQEDAVEEIEFTPAVLSLDLDGMLPPLPDLADPAEQPALATGPGALPAAPEPGAGFTITFRPHPSLFASGNEPLYLLRALRDLGPITVHCDTRSVPPLDKLDHETGCLAWRIDLATDEPEQNVRDVFEFVDGLCELEIAPTGSAGGRIHAPQPSPLPETPAFAPPLLPPMPAIPADAIDAPDASTGAMPPREPVIEHDDAPLQASQRSAPTQPRATVRVDLERIDRLVNLVGELVINQAMLSQAVTEAAIPPNSPVATGLEEFLQLTRDIQESVMMIRAQPIKSLFQRMGRIVREASASVGKEVRLHTSGENTEVDKTVIERLADPLTHMIRNAVDHGLESTEARIAAGKPRDGRITLTAEHRSGRIVIDVTDDGAGINRARVREKAIEKGLVPADAQLSDSDIDNILFMPGFSTAASISSLSGRGVGMDVVRSAIQALGGRVTISSAQGKGTTFSISLPLTLAVLDGMVVRVEGETLVVPLNAILETLTLTDEDLRALGPQTHVVQIRGGFVPLLDLGTELGYRRPKSSYIGNVVLLIGQEDGNRAALVVDAIEDQRQVVIKGLEASYGRVPGIAAATILGDGQIALILDPGDLVAQASGRTRQTPLSIQRAG